MDVYHVTAESIEGPTNSRTDEERDRLRLADFASFSAVFNFFRRHCALYTNLLSYFLKLMLFYYCCVFMLMAEAAKQSVVEGST